MKYLLVILLFISSVAKAQNTKLYAVRFNTNGTTDSFWVNPVICNGVHNSAGTYIMPCIDSMIQISGYSFPQSAGLFFQRADGIFSNLVFPGSTAIPQSQVTDLTTDLAGKLATNGNGSSLTGLTKTQVGLANVDNTSDAAKPISTATQTALNLKANLASPTFTGIVSGITASMVGLGNVTNESKATMFTSPTFTGTPVIPGYQPLATNLTSIGALANSTGFLKNDGAGNFTYDNPAGSGTVTNTGTLTLNAVVLGNGGADTKVSTGITTNGTAQLVLGVNTTTLGSVKMFGNTSGDATIQPSAVAGTNTVITLPNVSGTVMLNTATSGVANTPTASGTIQYAHGLGRIPTIIEIYGIGTFTSSASATPTPFSIGNFTSSGNRCVYMTSAGTTTQAPQSSAVFAIFVATSSGNNISGVIQNVTATTFDIVWTETGTATSQQLLWKAQ